MDGDKVYIFPRLGLVVRDPSSFTPLAESGETKTIIGPDGRYWRRRIKDGDVLKYSVDVIWNELKQKDYV